MGIDRLSIRSSYRYSGAGRISSDGNGLCAFDINIITCHRDTRARWNRPMLPTRYWLIPSRRSLQNSDLLPVQMVS
jgi:hypothetical protein